MRIASPAVMVASVAAALALAAVPARALVYDEAVHGDLGDDLFSPTFALSLGDNAVRGEVSRGDSAHPDDFDAFRVQLPARSVFTEVTFTAKLGAGVGSVDLFWMRIDDPGDFDYDYVTNVSVPGSLTIVSPGSAFRPPTGRIRFSGFELDSNVPEPVRGFRAVSYEFSFAVSPTPVPEPETAWLMLGGLAFVGGATALRRRRDPAR